MGEEAPEATFEVADLLLVALIVVAALGLCWAVMRLVLREAVTFSRRLGEERGSERTGEDED